MKNYFKPLSISLSPNVQKDDVALALKLLVQPWRWRQGAAIRKFEDGFAKYLGVKHAISFNSGRSAEYAILEALELAPGSNVGMQAFTCNAVVNPILWAGLNPVYIDCANDFNVDSSKLQASSSKFQVIIVQHTFGLPNLTPLQTQVCRGVDIIEDCAHALGAEINGRKVGTFGKAAFFSFSRDKVISCVYGGMATTSDDALAAKLRQSQKDFDQPSYGWILQQLLHPILLWFFILPLYNFIDLGKLLLMFSQVAHVLSKAVSWQEKRGQKPDYFPKALPNALAMLAQHQFEKLEPFNAHRKKIADFYFKELSGTKFVLPKHGGIFLRFAVQHRQAHEILYEAWHQQNMLLGDWYRQAIDPHDTQLTAMKYAPGMCPNAEYLAKKTMNLPTHINISINDAKRIVGFLKKYA